MPVELATAEAVRRAAAVIRGGGLVAFPTETVYGLGADALSPGAVGRVYAAKGRPAGNPLIVHVLDAAGAESLAESFPPVARTFAAAFWPGPLTLVVRRSSRVPDAVTAGGPTVALRAPAHPVARALLEAAGTPVAAPSANRSGQLSPTTAAHVAAGLGDAVDVILDGGACSGGIESTVVDVSGPTVRLLRPGLVTVAELERVAGGLLDLSPGAGQVLPSPGMLAKHYAPRTPLEVAESPDELAFLANLYETAGLRVARLRFPGTPAEVSARLYAELHAADAAGFDRLIAELPPNTDDWRAVRDRLTRAAAEE